MNSLKQAQHMLLSSKRKLKEENNPEKVYNLSMLRGAMEQLVYELQHDQVPTKICRTCKEEKPIDEFYLVRTRYKRADQIISKLYRRTECISCYNISNYGYKKQREFKSILS